jgi:hypothetical protein
MAVLAAPLWPSPPRSAGSTRFSRRQSRSLHRGQCSLWAESALEPSYHWALRQLGRCAVASSRPASP